MNRISAAICLFCLSIAVAFIGVTVSKPLSSDRITTVGTRDGKVIRAATNQAGSLTGFDVAIPLSSKELVEQAELILIGQCRDTMILWRGRTLYTLATIDVAETLKGGHAMAVTVAMPGGVDVNRRIPVAMTYPGATRIAPREDVVLFLVNADDHVAGSHAVVGLAQGKFSIVQTDLGVPMVSVHTNVLGASAAVPLATFKEEIRSYLGPSR